MFLNFFHPKGLPFGKFFMLKTQDPKGATVAQLAHLLACDVSLIDGLARKGIAIRLARGRYDAVATVRNYVKHLREMAAGRIGISGKDAVAANVAYRESQTALNNLKLKKERRELIPVENVQIFWAGIMRSVKQFVLGLPNQIAFEVPTLTVHDRKAITRLCREGLDDAAMGRGFSAVDAAQSEGGEPENDSP